MYYPAAVWGVGHFCTAWFAYGSAITYVCDSDVTILRVNKTRDVPPCRPCLLYVLVCLHVSSHPTPPPQGAGVHPCSLNHQSSSGSLWARPRGSPAARPVALGPEGPGCHGTSPFVWARRWQPDQTIAPGRCCSTLESQPARTVTTTTGHPWYL